MTSLTARTASSSSSAKLFSLARLPDCYCDPETETGILILSWRRMGRGPWGSCLFLQSPPKPLGFPLPSVALPRLPTPHPPEVEAGGSTPPHMHPHDWPGLASTPHWSHLVSYFSSGAGAQQSQMESLFILIPSNHNLTILRVLGDPLLPPNNASINLSIQGWKCPRDHRFLGLSPSSLSRPGVTAPFPSCPFFYNCSGSTEKGLSSNNVL